jgi:uncharacterized protein (DUF58 family)
VAVAAAGLLTLGTAARLAPVAAFGGAMLVAIAIGRAAAVLGVTRLRTAGFEMIWSGKTRVHRTTRGAPLVLGCELLNRSHQRVRVTGLHAIASSMLETSIHPGNVDLAPGTRATLEVTVRGPRVGRWGLHGLALQVSATPLGAEGLYEVPLLFASPVGIEVWPKQLASFSLSALGGRARRASETGRRGRGPGHADEVRELRDHAPGDPLKRVAWKASARRGRLLVREMDRDESDVVWIVVDASIELWAGQPGAAPLDRVMDEVATLAARLLRRGDRVGLAIVASRVRSWLVPELGAAQGSVIAGALASASGAVDADRSALDEAEVARLVAEHARPLESGARTAWPSPSLDVLAERVDKLRLRAPFVPRIPFAATPRERALRLYLSSFGIESPPQAAGEREKAESTLAGALEQIAAQKPRAGVVHVWAPAPVNPGVVAKAVASLRRRRVELRWSLPPDDWVAPRDAKRWKVAIVAEEVARMRASTARAKGERALRRLGVRVVVARDPKREPSSPQGEAAR